MKKRFVSVLRCRGAELNVLSNFDFEDSVFPYVEIMQTGKQRPVKKGQEKVYDINLDIEYYKKVLDGVKAKQVFFEISSVDGTSNKVADWRLNVYSKAENVKQFQAAFASDKLVPVVKVSVELNSQLYSLKELYPKLALKVDITQIDNPELQKIDPTLPDYVFLNIRNHAVDLTEIAQRIKSLEERFKKEIITISNPLLGVRNVDLPNDSAIPKINNSHLHDFYTDTREMVADYSGVKAEDIMNQVPFPSPGLIFYNPITFEYYGFKTPRYSGVGKRGNKTTIGKNSDYNDVAIPSLLESKLLISLSKKEKYIKGNVGIERLKEAAQGRKKGQIQTVVKQACIEHYLHCVMADLSQQP